MYAFIKGILSDSSPIYVVIDAGGIGYKIFIPAQLFTALPPIGRELHLYTSFVVRELSHQLYGFMASHERDLFETLMGVTGIGPKLALSIIGHIPMADLQRAVNNGDIAAICKVPGIGKKNSERLIIEMRDKINAILPSNFSELSIRMPNDPCAQRIHDAMNALINLGYNQMTAQKAIKQTLKDLPEGIDLATLITNALKNI